MSDKTSPQHVVQPPSVVDDPAVTASQQQPASSALHVAPDARVDNLPASAQSNVTVSDHYDKVTKGNQVERPSELTQKEAHDSVSTIEMNETRINEAKSEKSVAEMNDGRIDAADFLIKRVSAAESDEGARGERGLGMGNQDGGSYQFNITQVSASNFEGGAYGRSFGPGGVQNRIGMMGQQPQSGFSAEAAMMAAKAGVLTAGAAGALAATAIAAPLGFASPLAAAVSSIVNLSPFATSTTISSSEVIAPLSSTLTLSSSLGGSLGDFSTVSFAPPPPPPPPPAPSTTTTTTTTTSTTEVAPPPPPPPPPNRAPVANAAVNSVFEDGAAITGNFVGSDPDGDAITFSMGGAGLYGTAVMVNSGGAYRYTIDNTKVSVQALSAGQTVLDTLGYSVRDARGLTTNSTLAVTITGVNDAPTLTNLTSAKTVNIDTLSPAAEVIDSAVTLSDVDNTHLNGGNLTITYSSGGAAQDVLGIQNQGTGAGQISVSGTTVSYEGTAFGTITTDGSAGTNLVVSFDNVNATVAAIDALIQAITYNNTSSNPTTTRTLSYTVSDGSGGTSAAQLVTVTDTPLGYSRTLTSGVDSFVTGGGSDTFYVNTGSDLASTDTINAGAGNDVLVLGNGGAFSTTGFSVTSNKTGIDQIDFNMTSMTGSLFVNGTSFMNGTDNARLTINNGTIAFSLSASTLSSVTTVITGTGLVTGASGNSRITIADGVNGNVRGTTFALIAFGGTGNDTITGGGSVTDSITGGGGVDTLTGGTGNTLAPDTFIYNAISDSTTAATDVITDFGQSAGAGLFTATEPDRIYFTFSPASGAFNVYADNTTHSTANQIWAVQNGSDTYIYYDAEGDNVADMRIQLNNFTASNFNGGHFRSDSSLNIFGTTGVDIINSPSATGTANISTYAGADTITLASTSTRTLIADSGDDNDIIRSSGTGATTITAGAGVDTISLTTTTTGTALAYGGDGADIVSIASGSGANTIYGDAGADTFTTSGTGTNKLYGGDDNDTFTASAGTNSIYGEGGADIISLTGGSSASNILDGGAGADIITSAGTGTNTIYGGSENDTITTTAGTNIIYGDAGVDTIVSSTGNDTITGGSGIDTLTGGGGSDTFIYTAAADSATGSSDTITDFSGDKLDISGMTASAYNNLGNNSFASLANQVIWQQSGSDTVVSIDFGGDNVADFQVTLTGVTASNLTVDNFVWGAASSVTTTGTTGDDTITGDATKINMITADAGNDVITSGSNSDSINAGTGNDTVTAGGGNDIIVGGAGGDTLDGGAGNDLIYADGQTFDSSTISSLQVWFNANNLANDGAAVADGTAVATWVDAAGTATNAAKVNGSPTYNTNSIGGQNAITFDGNDNMNFTRNISGNFSIIAVFKTAALGAGPPGWFGGSGLVDAEVSNVTNDFGMSFSSTGSVMGGIGNPDTTVQAGSGLNDSAGHIAVFQRNQTGDLITIGVDNGTVVTSSAGGVQALTAPTNIAIGSIQTNVNYFNGDIAEVLVFTSALTSTERDSAYQYLAMKYGLTGVSGFGFAADTLTGGTGADTFTWTNNSYSSGDSSARDVITDFSIADGDKIDISGIVSAPFNVMGNNSFTSGVLNQINWQQSGANTIVSVDYGGDGTADWSIQLSNFTATNLSANDFTLGSNSVVTSTVDGTNTLTGNATKINIITANNSGNVITGGANGDYIAGGTGVDTISGGRGADYISGGNSNDTLIGGYGGDRIDGGAGNDVIFADNQAFTSSSIANLKLWLDASDVNADGTTGTASTTWHDKSGNNADATAVSAATFGYSTSMGGRATLTFTSAEKDYYTLADGTIVASGNSSYGTFSVASFSALSRYSSIYGSGLDSAGRDSTLMLNGGAAIRDNWWGAGTNDLDSTLSLTLNSAYIFNANYNSASGRTLEVNGGNTVTSSTITLNNAGTYNRIGLNSAADPNGVTAFYMGGNISEVITFQRVLTASEIQILQEYTSMKYGIALTGLSFGADVLTGGTGADTFTWSNASYSSGDSSARDVVTDFSIADGDKIDISSLIGTPVNLLGNTSFGSSTNQLIWAQSGSDTIVSLDYGGDGTADWSIQLSNFTATNLSATDFVINNVTVTLTSGADVLNYSAGTSNYNVTAAAGNDTITTGSGADTVSGGRGADTITGGNGADTLIGGYAGDVISGGAGNDVIYADNTAFTNSTVSGLRAWFDATDVNSDGTAASGDIATWADKSSGGTFDASASSAATLAYDSLLGGRAAMSFNSAEADYYTLSNAIFAAGNNGYGIFAVVRATDNAATHGIFGTGTFGTVNQSVRLQVAGSPGTVYDSWWGSELTSSAGAIAANTGYFISSVYDTTTGRSMSVSGDTATTNSGTTLNLVQNSSLLGNDYNTEYWKGSIAEVIIFNTAVSSANTQLLQEYLSFKYGLVIPGLSFGADTLTGGTGADTFTWTNASYSSGDNSARDIITDFNLSGGSYSAAEGDKIDISGLVSTPFNLLGNNGFGSSTNQVIWEQSGANTIVSVDYGGDGTADWSIQLSNFDAYKLSANDFVWGSNSSVTTTGTSGADTINGHATKINIIDGLGGADTITGGGNADYLNGGADNDVINAGAGNDVVDGGTGTDTIHGDGGNDQLRTTLNGGTDTIYGDAGDDVLVFVYGDNNDVTFYGGTGADGTGTDRVYLTGVGAVNDGTWSISSATSYTSSDLGNGVTRLAFDSANASGSITIDDGTVITFAELDRIEFT